MASGVVKVGRRTYAVGLLWQPSPSGRIAQAAREAAVQPGQLSDFYCVRPASKSVTIPQYGLAQSQQGHKAGMATLAASLANAQPGSWAGAFRLREGTWFVVVRDDLVAPDGDVLFDNDEAARDRLLQEVNLGGVQRIYAPDGWAVPGSDPTPLPLLLQDRADCRLQPVQLPMRLIIYGASAAAIVCLIIFLALQWQDEQDRLAQEMMEKARKQMDANKNGAISQMVKKWEWPPADQVYDKKWEKAGFVSDAITACHGMFTKVDAVQLGWKRGAVTCQDHTLTIIWSREKGLNAIVPLDSVVKDDLSTATQTIKADKPISRGSESLLSENKISELILRDKWPVTLSRLPDDSPIVSPPPNTKDVPPPPPSPWRKRGLKYSGKIPPWEMSRYFNGVPGLIMDKIMWDGSVWTIEVTIYEKRGG